MSSQKLQLLLLPIVTTYLTAVETTHKQKTYQESTPVVSKVITTLVPATNLYVSLSFHNKLVYAVS